MRLTKLIPDSETRWNIPKWAISNFQKRWCWWPSRLTTDEDRASTTRTLNRDKVTKVWRLDNCENFVGNGEELVLDAFIDSVILSQWIELRMEVIGLLQDLGALTSTNIHDMFNRVIFSTGTMQSDKGLLSNTNKQWAKSRLGPTQIFCLPVFH